MILKLDSLDIIYSMLSNFDDSNFGDNIEDRVSLKGFRYDSATLKYPLSEVVVSFKRNSGIY